MTLNSGLRVLVQENRSAPLVAIVAVYGSGTSSDPPGKEGLAHLVEHLTFRSTLQGQPLSERLRRAGATYNATTEPERTTYYAIAPAARGRELLEIEVARLLQPLEQVSDDVLEVERKVVLNEADQRGPSLGVRPALFKQAFGARHPLARESVGEERAVASLGMPAVKEFIEKHYRPENCTIVISGDVNLPELRQQMNGWPAALVGPGEQPGTAVVRPRLPDFRAFPGAPPEPTPLALAPLKGPFPGRQVVVGWSLPPDRRAGDPVLLTAEGAVFVSLLNSGWGGAYPRLIGSPAGSLMTLSVGVPDGKDPAKVRESLLDALGNGSSAFQNRWRVARLKWMTATGLMRRSADLLPSTLSLATYFSVTGRPSFFKDTLEQLASIQAIEVSDMLGKYLKRDRAVSVVIESDGTDNESSESGGLLGAEHDKRELNRSTTVSVLGMGDDDIRRTALSPKLGVLPRFKLANGLDVMVVSRASAPVAEITVRLARGDAEMYPVGLGSLAAGLSRSSCEGEAFLFEVGGSRQEYHRHLGRRYSAEVFSGNLANGLVALGDELRCRELAPEPIKRLGLQLKARDKSRTEDANDVYFHSADRFWKALYPDQAYGMAFRDQDALKRTSEADLAAALRAQYRPDGALAVVVTDRPVSEFRPHLDRTLGEWKRSEGPEPRPGRVAGPPPQARTLLFFPKSDAAQASLRLGCRLPTANGDTAAAHDLFEALIRREADEVRMSWGATYGLDVEVLSYPNGVAHLRVAGGVEHARIADAVQRLLSHLKQLADNGPDFKSFTLERWDLAADFNRRFATGSAIAEAVLFARDRGWPLDTWDRYPESLASVRRGNIKELAAACAGHEVVTVVGKAELAGQLKGLGLEPATVKIGK